MIATGVASKADVRGGTPAGEHDGNGQRGKAPPSYLQQLAERATLGTAAAAMAIVLTLLSRDSLDSSLQIAFACAFGAIPLAVAGYLCRELALAPLGLSPRFELGRNLLLVAIIAGLMLVVFALVALLSHTLRARIGSLGMSFGFVWLVVPPALAVGLFGKYLEAHPGRSTPEVECTQDCHDNRPARDMRAVSTSIDKKTHQ